MSSMGLDDHQRFIVCDTIERIPADFGGGSSALKSLVVGDLVVNLGYRTVVELGVYRGRFMLPQAALQRELGNGKVIGIDPYRAASARQRDWWRFPQAARKVNAWTDEQDWDAIYDQVEQARQDLGVWDHSELWRTTSSDAAKRFDEGSIDVLHIDGNHDRRAVQRDIGMYRPKLRTGGIVVFDDASWRTINPIVRRFSKRHTVLDVVTSAADDFVIVQV